MKKLCSDKGMTGEAAEVLKAIAHPIRLQIVAILADRPETVSALAERLEAPQSIVSQQLRILRMRGLVASSRQNGFSLYRLTEPHLKQIVRCMEGCLSDWDERRG